jgi:uncharacterized protein YraI
MSTRILLILCFALTACSQVGGTASAPAPTETSAPTDTSTPVSSATVTPTDTPLPTLTPAPLPTETASLPSVPVVESLDATVATNLLSCRYGPGSEYLYLDGLREGWKLKLVGQTGGNNWAWVKGTKNNCWVNVKYLKIDGDFKSLPVVYPDIATLPHTSYYPPTSVLSATRNGNNVTVTWLAVPISPGDYEDENMFNYIIEVWRCEGGQLLFDPLASNRETVSFIDEPGCAQASHGRVFVQEKHGYAGPAEIPWP